MNEIKLTLTLPQSLFKTEFIRLLEQSINQEPVKFKQAFDLIKDNWQLLDSDLRNQVKIIIEEEISFGIKYGEKQHVAAFKPLLDWIKENRHKSITATPLNAVIELPVVNIIKY